MLNAFILFIRKSALLFVVSLVNLPSLIRTFTKFKWLRMKKKQYKKAFRSHQFILHNTRYKEKKIIFLYNYINLSF